MLQNRCSLLHFSFTFQVWQFRQLCWLWKVPLFWTYFGLSFWKVQTKTWVVLFSKIKNKKPFWVFLKNTKIQSWINHLCYGWCPACISCPPPVSPIELHPAPTPPTLKGFSPNKNWAGWRPPKGPPRRGGKRERSQKGRERKPGCFHFLPPTAK